MNIKDIKKFVSHLIGQKSIREAVQIELAEYIAPQRGLFDTDTNTGKQRNPHIINNAAQRSLDKSSAGFTGAMTPQTQPWFKIDYVHKAQKELLNARLYTEELERIAMAELLRGGFYAEIHEFNQDLLAFACALILAEYTNGKMLFTSIPIGSYAVAVDEEKKLIAVARKIRLTATQIKMRFGEEKMSEKAKQMLQTRPYDTVVVTHFVTKREKYNPEKLDSKNMPYASYYYEENAESLLSESGYTSMPYFFTAWSDNTSIYGTGLGDKCLDDQRNIDALESRKIVGTDKLIDPPLKISSSYKKQFDTFAGGLNTMSANELDSVKPLYDVNSFAQALPHLQNDIQRLEMRIDTNMYASTFVDIAMENRPTNMSATEYSARRRDRIQQIEPSLSSYEPRILTPILERLILVLEREGRLPMPPENLGENIALNIKFTSPMSQVLNEIRAQETKVFVQEVFVLAQAQPTVLDKIDTDQLVDELAGATNIFASVVRPDKQVQEIRQKRQEEQAQQQQLQMLAMAGQQQQNHQGE